MEYQGNASEPFLRYKGYFKEFTEPTRTSMESIQHLRRATELHRNASKAFLRYRGYFIEFTEPPRTSTESIQHLRRATELHRNDSKAFLRFFHSLVRIFSFVLYECFRLKRAGNSNVFSSSKPLIKSHKSILLNILQH